MLRNLIALDIKEVKKVIKANKEIMINRKIAIVSTRENI